MMGTKRIILSTCLLLAIVLSAQAQNRQRAAFDSIRIERWKTFNKARTEALRAYNKAVRQAWQQFKGEPAEVEPEEQQVLPVLVDENGAETDSFWDGVKSLFRKKGKKEPRTAKLKPIVGNGEALNIGQQLSAAPAPPQPKPLFEVADVPKDVQRPNDYKAYNLFGLTCKVRIGENCRVGLRSLSPDDVADAMKVFEEPQFANMLHDCLEVRKQYKLSDWAYYLLLQRLTDDFYGKNTSNGALVLSYLYSQSGYKMRMVHDQKRLMMVAASHHFIYGKDYTFADYPDNSTRYYLLDGRRLGTSIYVCNAKWPKESGMSLQLTAEQAFLMSKAPQRTIRSRRNAGFAFTITANKNYIDFYDTYPSACIDGNFMTRWQMYAETPMDKDIRDQLYPAMREKLRGYPEVDAVRQLLWWSSGYLDDQQTNAHPEYLQYAYDEDVWGTDRAFFAEETLFYPWCDCEDRAILFSRLVRDIVGLDVALVHYPGHLATAVAFNEPVRGDYFKVADGRRFTVCDPTILVGDIGMTMDDMVGKPATLMILKR